MEQRRTFNLPGSGLHCGSCDAALPKVRDTRQIGGLIVRQRICPACGAVNETAERVFNTRPKRSRFRDAYE